jgi:putative Holliday junction resolvase
MPELDLPDFARLAEGGRPLAAIDLGEKSIGFAVSDRSHAFAHPRAVIRRRRFTEDARTLIATLAAEDAAGLVVGLPRNMDGSEGPRAQATRAFMRNLERLAPIPHLFWDERLSTVAAERALVSMDVSRRKRGTRIDSAAAAFILQGVLDRLRAMR